MHPSIRALINTLQTAALPRTACYAPPIWRDPARPTLAPIADVIPPTPATVRNPVAMLAPRSLPQHNMGAYVKKQLAAIKGESCP